MAVSIEEISELLDKKLKPIKDDIKEMKKDIKAIKEFTQLDMWEEEVTRRKNNGQPV